MQTAPDIGSLVAQAKHGDLSAMDTIVDIYSSRLYGFAVRMVGRPADAEDIVQETFLRLVRGIHEYEEAGKFEAWLFRIAANLVRDGGRRMIRSPMIVSIDEQHDDQEFHGPRDGSATVDESVSRREAVDQLQRALDHLPQAEREVVLLRHYTDMSFAEIAELMGSPLGTALARAHRGLGKLRTWMEGES